MGTSGGCRVLGGALLANAGPSADSTYGEVIVTHSGTLVRDLQKMVDICLRWNTRICTKCGQFYGVHSESDAHCPNPASAGATYLETRFAELRGKGQAPVTAVDVIYENSPGN